MRNLNLKTSGLLVLVAMLLVGPQSRAADDKVAFLSQKLKEVSSFKVRLKAAVLLGRMADLRAVEPLSEALDDENYVVRGAAARALGNLGHPMAVSAVEPLLDLVSDEEQFVRKEAKRALERLAGPKSIDYFIAALSNDDARVRLASVHVLAIMNIGEARVAIIPALGDNDEEVRAEAIVAIKGLGADELEKILELALARQDNYQVQATAAQLAGEMKVTAVMDKLSDLLIRDDVVPEVKREASESLASMKDQLDIGKQVAFLKSEDNTKRDQAIKLLGIHGGHEAVDALMALLRSDDNFVRRRAVTALGDAGDPRSIPALEFLLKKEEDQRLKEQIERTLRKIKPR